MGHDLGLSPLAGAGKQQVEAEVAVMARSTMVRSRTSQTPDVNTRVTIDGKQFALQRQRFLFRGVTYGTFEPRPSDGAHYPERDRMKQDFESMAAAGFTVVRTY